MNGHGRGSEREAALYEALMQLKSPEEFYIFLQDLCTDSEQAAMEQRFEVALMLDDGATYNEILEKTSVGSATVTRVKRCVSHGAGGYRIALDRLKGEKSE